MLFGRVGRGQAQSSVCLSCSATAQREPRQTRMCTHPNTLFLDNLVLSGGSTVMSPQRPVSAEQSTRERGEKCPVRTKREAGHVRVSDYPAANTWCTSQSGHPRIQPGGMDVVGPGRPPDLLTHASTHKHCFSSRASHPSAGPYSNQITNHSVLLTLFQIKLKQLTSAKQHRHLYTSMECVP